MKIPFNVVKPLVIFTLIGCGTVLGQSPARRELDPAVAARDAAMNKRLDAVIDRAVKEERIVGISMLVAHNGKGVYRRAAGWTDREAKKKMRGNDLFRLASMSKLIVWVAALALVDEGKLGLDDAVTKYLSDFRPQLADGRAPKITVRQLLTHTAGLNYGFLEKSDGPYHRLKVSDGLDDIGITLEENLRRIAAAPLLFEPGTSWNYSVATDVLGGGRGESGRRDSAGSRPPQSHAAAQHE